MDMPVSVTPLFLPQMADLIRGGDRRNTKTAVVLTKPLDASVGVSFSCRVLQKDLCFSVLRTVSNFVASALGVSPKSTSRDVFEKLRRAVQSKKFKRIVERLVTSPRYYVGVGMQSVQRSGSVQVLHSSISVSRIFSNTRSRQVFQ